MILDSINSITDFIFINDNLRKAEIIFVPGTSTHETVENAASLYRQGLANMVLVSGKFGELYNSFPNENLSTEKYGSKFKYEYEYMREILIKNGVLPSHIICEKEARNTLQNAIKIKELLKKNNICINSAIICTQSYHARRALLTFQRVFPDVEFLISASDTRQITKETWWWSKNGFIKVLSELEKCGKYWLDDWEEIQNELLRFVERKNK